MNKLLTSLGVALTLALSGCTLYFGGHGGHDRWTYCGADGFYVCEGDNCTWQGASCPGGDGGTGYTCTSDRDCAAGCYCADSGTCEEAGFCTTDADCGPGFVCDVSRSSCEPAPPPPPPPPAPVCGNGRLETGEACDDGNTTDGDGCSATCTVEPQASCVGTLTCNLGAPRCPADQVPLILDGCYTGECKAIAQCDAPPVCEVINTEASCLARTDCGAVYTGMNCTKADGSACRAGDAGCTCQSFSFASCKAKASARQVFEVDGLEVDAAAALR